MTEVNSMYRAQTRSDDLKAQIEKLEGLAHHAAVNPTFDRFDAETEDILMKIYGREPQVCGVVQIRHGGGSRSAGEFA
jgi:hypothetical protein